MAKQSGFLLAVMACSCSAPSAAPPRTTPVATDPPGRVDAAPASNAACQLTAGGHDRSLEVSGLTRRYRVLVGEQVGGPAPVLFSWHGFGGSAARFEQTVQPARFWNDAVVVVPAGEGRTFKQFGDRARPGWQIAKGELEDRDLLFFDAMVQDLSALGCVDRSRIYSTGFSNGGFFSNVLACHRSEVVAAVAPVGGGGPFVQSCGSPVPVLVSHGTQDDVVPFDSAQKTVTFWMAHNRCEETTPPADACVAAVCQGAAVEFCAYPAAHRWPVQQAERVAAFLRKHTR